MSCLLLPFAGQSPEVVEAAAHEIRRRRDGVRMRVGYIDAEGYPLQGEVLPLRVLLATRGNPDYGQDPARPPVGMPPDRFLTAVSLEEAKEIVAKYISDNDVGGGQWVGGDVWQGGRRLGGIAYNGRFFDADDPRGYGKPSVEFAQRMAPTGAALRKLLDRSALGEAAGELEHVIDPEFALQRFVATRSADEWRSWYAAEVEREAGLGSRTLAPALDPVLVEVHDDETRLVTRADELRVGAAFLRGDACINAIVIEPHALRPALSV